MKIFFSRSIKLDQCAFLYVCRFVNFFLPSFGKTNQMERFGFFLLLTKIKVDNYLEGEKEFTELVSNFTETPKRFRSI
jgi:hypothetical protein